MLGLKSIFSRERPMTTALLVTNGLVFVALTLLGGTKDMAVLIRWGALVPQKVWQGEYWRLVTPMFIHIGMLHFLANMYALLILGRIVEQFLGSGRFAALYLVSGVSGCIGSLLLTKGISAGASGAIFGLLGALLAAEYMMHASLLDLLKNASFGSVMSVIVLNLVLGAMIPVIDNYAHIGGLVAGFSLGYYFAARRFLRLEHYTRSTRVLAVFAILAVAGLAKGVRPSALSWEHEFKSGVILLYYGEKPELAVPYLERAAKLNPKSYKAWFVLAQAYGLTHPPDWSRALAAVRHARKLAPKTMEAQIACAQLHGQCLEKLYQTNSAEALKVYTDALAIFPKAKAIRSRAVACAMDLGRYEDALKLAKAGLKEFSRDVWSFHGIERACRALGRKAEADKARRFIMQYYEREYRTRPNASNANNLAWAYADAGAELDKALFLAKEAVKDIPKNPESLDTLGWVQFKRGDLKAAITTLEKVVKLQAQANYGYYHLAAAFAAAKRYGAALQAVRRALAIKSIFEDRWAAKALEQELEAKLSSASPAL